jgi:predicted transposase YbfD/YdcC
MYSLESLFFQEESMTTTGLALWRYFFSLKDPRVKKRTEHRLLDIIAITLCGVIAGCKDWQKIEIWAKQQHTWLKTFLALPGGIPSHDTLERTFARLHPLTFQNCFRNWMTALHQALGLQPIAIDGKTLCGSGQPSTGLSPLHLVSAWVSANQLTLGQVAVDSKSNEITAIPELLKLLELQGALITIDAIGCQKKIVEQIVQGGGDYLITVKENQGRLMEDIQQQLAAYFDDCLAGKKVDYYETEDRGHGRYERRRYTVLNDLDGIRDRTAWANLQVVGMCYHERTVNGETSHEVRYFIGSKQANARFYGEAFRGHWGIENPLHWRLDVLFGEDANRVRDRTAAENLAWLRRVAITLLKQHRSKGSLSNKSFQALLDPNFLQQILEVFVNPGKV